jgi:hypothetical protein
MKQKRFEIYFVHPVCTIRFKLFCSVFLKPVTCINKSTSGNIVDCSLHHIGLLKVRFRCACPTVNDWTDNILDNSPQNHQIIQLVSREKRLMISHFSAKADVQSMCVSVKILRDFRLNWKESSRDEERAFFPSSRLISKVQKFESVLRFWCGQIDENLMFSSCKYPTCVPWPFF